MFEPTDDALTDAARRLDELVTADCYAFEATLAQHFRLSVDEYAAVLGAFALVRYEKTQRAFLRSFGANLNHDDVS